MVIIRRMQADDVASIADLTSQLGYPATESDIRQRFDFIKDRWDARLLVAQHMEHRVVGWIHVADSGARGRLGPRAADVVQCRRCHGFTMSSYMSGRRSR